jgi:hypothetical protein
MNTKSIGIVGGILIGLMLLLQACNLKSFVKFEPPKDVRETLDITEKVSYDDADKIVADWNSYVLINTEALKTAVAHSEESYAVLHQLTSTALETAGGAAGGIPYGGMIFGLLTGVTGLLLPSPIKKK